MRSFHISGLNLTPTLNLTPALTMTLPQTQPNPSQIAKRILQVAQTHKFRATVAPGTKSKVISDIH